MIKVLIVDDDKLARKGIISLLHWEKHQMEVVGDVQNGKEALKFLNEQEADLIFVDIDMPEMDGITFMEQCSAKNPEIRFVVLTFYEEFSYAQAAIRLGCLEYISKASLEFTDGDSLLDRIEKKFDERNQGFVRNKDGAGEEWEKIKEQWNSLYWIFDTIFYKNLMAFTKAWHPKTRILERQIVKCIGKADNLLGRSETDVPWFQSEDEMMDWVDQIRSEYRNSDKLAGNEFTTILKAVKLIEQRYTEPIHAPEVASEIGMSRSYFSVKFKKYTGSTFGDFIQNFRMQKAEELLLHTNLGIMEIAWKSGYEDVYYFNRVFREKFQCSPAEYRKREKEQE